jgi:hypothetical protein
MKGSANLELKEPNEPPRGCSDLVKLLRMLAGAGMLSQPSSPVKNDDANEASKELSIVLGGGETRLGTALVESATLFALQKVGRARVEAANQHRRAKINSKTKGSQKVRVSRSFLTKSMNVNHLPEVSMAVNQGNSTCNTLQTPYQCMERVRKAIGELVGSNVLDTPLMMRIAFFSSRKTSVDGKKAVRQRNTIILYQQIVSERMQNASASRWRMEVDGVEMTRVSSRVLSRGAYVQSVCCENDSTARAQSNNPIGCYSRTLDGHGPMAMRVNGQSNQSVSMHAK